MKRWGRAGAAPVKALPQGRRTGWFMTPAGGRLSKQFGNKVSSFLKPPPSLSSLCRALPQWLETRCFADHIILSQQEVNQAAELRLFIFEGLQAGKRANSYLWWTLVSLLFSCPAGSKRTLFLCWLNLCCWKLLQNRLWLFCPESYCWKM